VRTDAAVPVLTYVTVHTEHLETWGKIVFDNPVVRAPTATLLATLPSEITTEFVAIVVDVVEAKKYKRTFSAADTLRPAVSFIYRKETCFIDRSTLVCKLLARYNQTSWAELLSLRYDSIVAARTVARRQ
jgi:hypothetical protein